MKEKIKLVIVFILGIMISVVISVYAATVISAGEVSFNGSTSNITYNGTTAANVSDAINGVYTSANTMATKLNKIDNTVLFNTLTWGNSTGTTGKDISITNLSNYSTILVNYRVGDCEYSSVVYNDGSTNSKLTSTCYTSTTWMAYGSVTINFSSNKITITPLAGAGWTDKRVGLNRVVGLMKK